MAHTEPGTRVNYRVLLENPGAHVVEVVALVADAPKGPLRFSLPAWIPGSYMIRDYARHVLSVDAKAGDRELVVRKIDKTTWEVDCPAGPVEIRSRLYAFDLSVRGAYFDGRYALLNGTCLFFRFDAFANERCSVDLLTPDSAELAGWQVATGMERITGEPNGYGAFGAPDYDTLIDNPFLIGDLSIAHFAVAGVDHGIAIAGRHAADMDRLTTDLPLICEAHVDLFGRPSPVDRYWFLVIATDSGYGGLEHCYSTVLMCARDELPASERDAATSGYRRFLGLASHEYFHLWNVKRIRPAELVGADLTTEAYTRQLWLFEGITSYYDDLALLRSGLIGESGYLELVGKNLTRIYRTPGRRHQTLEESSFDAWTRFYKQDENSPNAIVSYYAKGAMVALTLDLEIRVKTEGRLSLDDVMRTLWEKYGAEGSSGVPQGAFEELAEAVTGLDLQPFFREHLRGTVDPPVGILLAQFGISLRMRAATSTGDTGGKPAPESDGSPAAWLGLRTRTTGSTVSVAVVMEGGPAQDVGLNPRDELVAIDGLRVSAATLQRHMAALTPDAPIALTVFRGQELLEFTVIPDDAPKDTCFLEIDADADAASAKRRTDWWGAAGEHPRLAR